MEEEKAFRPIRFDAIADRKIILEGKVESRLTLGTKARNTKRSQSSRKYFRRACERCQNQFTTRWYWQRFCRRRCQYIAYCRKLRRSNAVEQRTCVQLRQIIYNVSKGQKILLRRLQKAKLGDQQAVMKQLDSRTNSGSYRDAILNGTVQVWQILHLLRDECFISLREASKICGLSKNTLLTSQNLAKYQPGGRGGKILIKKSELFHWIENTRVLELDLDAICRNALDGLRTKKVSSK